MKTPPVITRGEDAVFIIRLVDSYGNPYDLSNYVFLQLRMAQDPIGAVVVTDAVVPAVASTAVSDGVTFSAVTPGINGNNIILVFDGTSTVATITGAWNTANPSNTVSYSGLGTVVLSAQTVQLDEGFNSFQKLLPKTPLQIGTIKVMLRAADTTLLKLGKNQTIELTIDKYQGPPAGQRKVILLAEAVSVVEKFF